MPEHDHTASAAKPTALLPRPVSICRGTKIIGMFLPRWLFRARLTLSAVFFRHFSRPPAAPACFRPISALSPLPASGPLVPARLPLPPASGRFPLSPPLPASGPLVPARLPLLPASGRFPLSPPAPPPGHWSRRVCRSCLPLPARRSLRGTFCRFLPLPALFFCICSALSFAARHFLHLLGSSFHGTSFPALFCGACSRLRFTDLFPLAISRLFRLPFPTPFACACPAFPFAISPRLSPALASLFLLRFPRAFRP